MMDRKQEIKDLAGVLNCASYKDLTYYENSAEYMIDEGYRYAPLVADEILSELLTLCEVPSDLLRGHSVAYKFGYKTAMCDMETYLKEAIEKYKARYGI